VGNTLTTTQATTLMGLRTGYYKQFSDYQNNPDAYDCTGAWLYASKLNTMPDIENTDFLFGTNSVTAIGAEITEIAQGLSFAEGPAADANGNLWFSDITVNLIYQWSADGGVTVFKENSGGANGLFLDSQGNLLACAGTDGRLVSIDPLGAVTVLADKYDDKAFNEPNDLWIDPNGGVYFSDPVYFKDSPVQDGEHVYYLTSDRSNVIRVINDMVRPNGIIGTPDGKTLYVTDHGAGKTYKYTINTDGTLSDKTLFVSIGSDGMTIDDQGNVYLTDANGVLVYNASGMLIETISVTNPTNVCFGGVDGQTLFITARTSVYAIQMRVKGASAAGMTLIGDIDGDSDVDLADAIIALQVVTGFEPALAVHAESDVNGDGRVGLEEACYILRAMSGADEG